MSEILPAIQKRRDLTEKTIIRTIECTGDDGDE